MSKITLVRNDYNYDLTFNVKEYNEVVVDLTSATPVFKAALNTGSIIAFSGNCSVTDASNGICTYTVQSTDFDTSGEYNVELQITYAGGKVITATMDNIIIIDDLP